MPCFKGITYKELAAPSDKEIVSLLEEVNSYFDVPKFYVNTHTWRRKRLLFKSEIKISYELLADVNDPWGMLVLFAGGSSRETILAWLYGFLTSKGKRLE